MKEKERSVSKIKNLKEVLFNKTWKKCLLIFIIIFSFVLVGGVLSINYLNDAVTNNHIHTETVIVSDKMYGDNSMSDYYIVIAGNKTYSIPNHNDGYGEKMFEKIEVGSKYKFVVKEPEVTNINQFSHILQVYNITE